MIVIRKMLCATDIERPARAALRFAFFVAERFHSSLEVVHAWDPLEETGLHAELSKAESIRQSTSEQGLHERLDSVVRAVPAAAVGRATTHIVDGMLVPAVLGSAERLSSDLIVLGTNLDTKSTAEARETVVDAIARASSCPVLTVPYQYVPAALQIQRVLLPLEGSLSVDAAAEWAAAFAARFNGIVELLHVQTSPSADDSLEARGREVEEGLRLAGVSVEVPAPVRGGLVECLLARIAQGGCDLMILGATSHAGQSVASLVRQRSSAPVLSIRSAGPDRLFAKPRFNAQGSSRATQGASSSSASAGGLPKPTRAQSLAEQRRVLLRDEPASLGASWATGWRQTLQAEGRAVMGGWPGTLPEARERVRRHFDVQFSQRGMALLAIDELALATSVTYERAKVDWMRAVRDAKKRPRTESHEKAGR